MIASVKHISILCMKEDRETLVNALQKYGKVMLVDTDESVRSPAASADSLRRIEKLREGLKPFAAKKGFLSPVPEVTEADFGSVSGTDVEAAGEMEKTLAELSAKNAVLAERQALADQLQPWKALDISVKELNSEPKESDYVYFVPGVVPVTAFDALSKAAESEGIALEIVGKDDKTVRVVAAVMKGDGISVLSANGFEKAFLPQVDGKPADVLEKLVSEIDILTADISAIKEKLSVTATDSSTDLLYEQYKAINERETIPVAETEDTVLLEGWIDAKDTESTDKAIAKAIGVSDVEYRDPLPDEAVPTVLHNSKLVSQFEGITNMFSVPRYGGIDPNPVMAPWYWIIFGLMMGDAGYGAMMVIFGLAFKFIVKPKGGVSALLNVILYSSITSVISGVVFGSYFGETWHPLLFSPLEEPIKMLLFTLVVGLLHIFTGLVTKIYYNIKAGKVLDAIFDQLSWMFVLSGLGIIFLPGFKNIGMILAIVGAVIVLFTAGRAKPSILSKITGGLLGLYDVTGYLSDILSYSRILALSLATGVVGMVMNILAGMVSGSIPVIGLIFALVIYVVGHVFNLALGLLSAYVHDCRLQYIEFYGKFYEGNGELFKPFSIKTKLVSINNKTEEN